ncbi:hypothetical protein COHA_003958 [Chlorella ohadii]|uniref:Large-conductance mechanosensitive channel n=1 Tax=Chlorella ohadii TaxID=2649997 RepID=A0AAD5DTQ5_9CHLO|nr:hypothetical protein COHA_003958 [Chlorella ohadii]
MACCLRPGGCAASCAVPSCTSANVRAGASRAAIQTYGCLGSVCSGFRDFVLRGNVIDLAVAIVVGTSFTALVNALVADWLTPIIGVIFGDLDGTFGDLSFTIRQSVFRYGHFLNVLLSFVFVCISMYFLIVLPVNALMKAYFPAKKTRPCPECCSDIPTKAKRCKFCCAPVEPLPPTKSEKQLQVAAEDNGDEIITRSKTAPAAPAGDDAKLEVEAKGTSPAVARSQSAPLPLCDKV